MQNKFRVKKIKNFISTHNTTYKEWVRAKKELYNSWTKIEKQFFFITVLLILVILFLSLLIALFAIGTFHTREVIIEMNETIVFQNNEIQQLKKELLCLKECMPNKDFIPENIKFQKLNHPIRLFVIACLIAIVLGEDLRQTLKQLNFKYTIIF